MTIDYKAIAIAQRRGEARIAAAKARAKRADQLEEGDRISVLCPRLQQQVWAEVIEVKRCKLGHLQQQFMARATSFDSMDTAYKLGAFGRQDSTVIEITTRSNSVYYSNPIRQIEVQQDEPQIAEVVRLGRSQPKVFQGISIN